MQRQSTKTTLVFSLCVLTVITLAAAAFGEDLHDVIGVNAVPQSQKRLSLSEAQTIALKQNPEVRQAALEISKSTAHWKSIMAQRYPQLLAIAFEGQQVNSIGGKYFENLAVLPGAFQPLTQQYRLDLQVREAGFVVQISQQRFRLAKQHTVAEVKKTYLQMLALQSSIASLKENLIFLNELERYVQSEVKRGAVLQVDHMLVQARLARAEFELDRSVDDLITMGQNLNRMLGRPPRSEINLVDEAVAPYAESNETAEINRALLQRPELSEVKLEMNRANLEKRVELSRYIPDISFGLTGIFSKELSPTLPRTFASVGFLLTWEPWDWGRKIQISRESETKVHQDKIKLQDLSEAVSIAVDKARRDIRLAEKEAKAGELGELSTKEELRVVRRRFKAGAALLKDVLEAQTAYTKAIAENVKAKTDVAVAQVALDEASGRDFQ